MISEEAEEKLRKTIGENLELTINGNKETYTIVRNCKKIRI
jgi:hypothetical protein